MADQTGSGTLTGTASGVAPHGSAAHEESHHGRPVSWVAVAIIVIGFTVGGIAMVPAPKWVLFWVGAGIAIVGTLIAMFSRTFDDWY